MQYKFRGIKTDGSGWVYGDLLTESYPITMSYKPPFIIDKDGMWEVIPETICQEIPNKNGMTLFTGDIMKLVLSDGSCLWRYLLYDNENMRYSLMNLKPSVIDTPMGFSFSWLAERTNDIAITGTILDHLLKPQI